MLALGYQHVGNIRFNRADCTTQAHVVLNGIGYSSLVEGYYDNLPSFPKKPVFSLNILSMVGSESKPYQSYFAQPRARSSSTRPKSTDKTKENYTPVSPTSHAAISSVDDNESPPAAAGQINNSNLLPSGRSKKDVTQEVDSSLSPSHIPKGVKTGSPDNHSSDSMCNTSAACIRDKRHSESVCKVHLNRRKKEIVDRIMVQVFQPLFNQWLGDNFGNKSEKAVDGDGQANTQGRKSTSNSDRCGGDGGGSGGGGDKNPNGGQKRQSQSDESEGNGKSGDGADDRGDPGRNNKKRARRDSEPSEDKRLLACPFHQHNPDKYKSERSCCGPGWATIHRLKEHLYRRHLLPEFQCSRCYGVFDNDADMKAHVRSDKVCMVSKDPAPDGLTVLQHTLIKPRTRPGTNESNWEKIYQILFPGESVPSPYYSFKSTTDSHPAKKKPKLERIEQFISAALPPIVRRELEVAVEKELNCVEDGMKEKAVEIFCNLQHKLLRTFLYTSGGLSTPKRAASPRKESDADSGVQPEPEGDEEDANGELPLELLEMLGPSEVMDDPDEAELFNPNGFDLNSFLGTYTAEDSFGGACSSFGELDSAYGTMSNAYSHSGASSDPAVIPGVNFFGQG